MYKYIVVSLVLFVAPFLGNASSNPKVDSLLTFLNGANDSSRIEVLTKLCWECRNSQPNKSIEYGLEAIELAQKFKDYKNLVKVHSFVGVAYRIIGNYSKSTDYYYLGLELAKKHKITEQEGFAYINIANLHIYQEYYNNAIENLNKALVIAKSIDNKLMLSYVHLNLGRAKLLLKNYDSAYVEFNSSLALRREINFTPGLAVCFKYIGDIYFEKGDYFLAIKNYNESQHIVNKESDKDLYANILVRKAELFLKTKEVDVAIKYAEMAHGIAQEIGAKLTIRDALKVITQVAKGKERYQQATGNLESIISYNDTLFNQQLSEKLFFLEYQYEKQKKESEIEIKELKLIRARLLSAALLIIVALLIVLFVIVLATLKHRKEKNKKLQQQNSEITEHRFNIEQKNKNLEDAYRVIEGYIGKITDSIRYAERIQDAILPSLSVAKPYVSDIFCMYKPKDFVSGDFYWIIDKGNILYVAVADCTGHGVPGAFMSIIGLDMLNQAINQLNILEPSQILDYINKELPLKLHKDEEELVLKDAMDIAICCFDKKSKVVSYSGALIPLTICRENTIIEIKPSPISIGISKKVYQKNFEQKKVQLQPNDWIYLYTDGFIDQFGGENGRKFLKKRFFETLSQISSSDGKHQKAELNRTFSQWNNGGEQVDDVLVLGLLV